MKKTILTTLVILTTIFSGYAQKIVKDSAGNYIQVRQSKTGTGATKTGQTYTTTDGQTYEIFVSINGKYFINRISKNGNEYKQYLKLN
jgi:hypothetical protein